MRSVTLALLLVALCASKRSQAQNVVNDSTASVIAYWEPGDVRHYRVERNKSGARIGRSTYTITLRVLDATDSTYLLESRVSELVVEADLPDDPRDRAVFQRILGAAEGSRILCSTDETGIPIALVNEQEVEEHARQVLLGILDMALSPSERLEMELALQPVLDAEMLAQDALEDLGNLLFPFGVAYITGRREEVQAEIPNPMGGVPFGTQQVFTMTQMDPTAQTARMRMEQHIDPKAVDDDMEELLNSCGGMKLEGEAREGLRRTIEGITVNDTMDIEVDLKGAWTTRVVFVRKTRVKGLQEVDQRTYTLIDKQAPSPR